MLVYSGGGPSQITTVATLSGADNFNYYTTEPSGQISAHIQPANHGKRELFESVLVRTAPIYTAIREGCDEIQEIPYILMHIYVVIFQYMTN